MAKQEQGVDKDGRQKVSRHVSCPFNAVFARRLPHFSFVHQPSQYDPKAIAAVGQYKLDSKMNRGPL